MSTIGAMHQTGIYRMSCAPMRDHAGQSVDLRSGRPRPARNALGPSLAAKRQFFESGAAWPGEPAPDCIETHAALVFLTRDRAWKMKKPVNLGYLDLRSLPARRAMCEEELALNRALAGEVYRGLTPLVERPDGGLALGGTGVVVDWLVEMRRLPEDRMLDRLLQAGQIPKLSEIELLSDQLIAFYQAAEPVADAGPIYLDRWLREARINAVHLIEMQRFLPEPLDPAILGRAIGLLESCRDEILQRAQRGIIVEGHGDLRPEHVCLEETPVIFDRLEFDRDLRLADPFEEFNYLGLECAWNDKGWIRAVLLVSLSQSGMLPPSCRLMTAYGVNRCLTRARLAIDHMRDANPRTPRKWPAQAQRYLAAAQALGGNLARC